MPVWSYSGLLSDEIALICGRILAVQGLCVLTLWWWWLCWRMPEITNLHWNKKVFMFTILSSLEMLKAVKLTAFNISNEDKINSMSKPIGMIKCCKLYYGWVKRCFCDLKVKYVLLLQSPNYIESDVLISYGILRPYCIISGGSTSNDNRNLQSK